MQIADITFNFWNPFAEVLYDKNNERLNEVFRPCVKNLVTALSVLCRYRSNAVTIQSVTPSLPVQWGNYSIATDEHYDRTR